MSEMKRALEDFHSFEIVYFQGKYHVNAYGVYPESSVLAGHSWCPRSISEFDTLKEAKENFPNARFIGGVLGTHIHPLLRLPMPDLPPPDFDPADAGERWEEDY